MPFDSFSTNIIAGNVLQVFPNSKAKDAFLADCKDEVHRRCMEGARYVPPECVCLDMHSHAALPKPVRLSYLS